MLRLVTDILTTRPKGTGTDLAGALTYLTHVAKRKTVAFLISDFLAADYEKGLRIVARKHDLVPVGGDGPLREQFPALGIVDLEDPESGARFTVDTSANLRVRGRFARFMAARREERTRCFQKLKLDSVELRAHEEYAQSLQKFFRLRARRLGV